jgi:glyoxylase-like metal-dependent hydrolase (beta-lactamase superfamily II)
VLQPDTDIQLGDTLWQVHAAPGHDPHSVILFEPTSRVLISADALWERGFGVIFPELEGLDAFDAVADTLVLIESLQPAVVIPGHGSVFTDAAGSIAFARARLRGFQADPAKHIQHAAKVLLKFKLLETQSQTLESFIDWAQATSVLQSDPSDAFCADRFHAVGRPVDSRSGARGRGPARRPDGPQRRLEGFGVKD